MRLLFLICAFSVAGAAQAPVAQVPDAAPRARYDLLQAQIDSCFDLPCLRAVDSELQPIGAELERRDLLRLKQNSLAFGRFSLPRKIVVVDRGSCRRSLWRRLRHCRKPGWCNR